MRFSDMLERKAEDIQRPPTLPVGTYTAMVSAHPDQDEITGKDGTVYDKLTFLLKTVAAVEVDEDELKDFGKVAGLTLRHDFLFNTDPEEEAKREGSLNRLKVFLQQLGAFEDGMTLAEGIANSVNAQCIVDVGHRLNPNDDTQVFAEIKNTFEA